MGGGRGGRDEGEGVGQGKGESEGEGWLHYNMISVCDVVDKTS